MAMFTSYVKLPEGTYCVYIYNYIILYIYTGKMDKTRSDKIEVRFTIYPNEMRSDYTHT